MMDGRRHSVDIPISKTLVALRRVRSLRDPTTNSMSKLASLIDNAHWENSSSNGISLRFLDSSHTCGSDDNVILNSRNFGLKGLREQDVTDFELNSGLLNSKPNSFGIACHERQRDDGIKGVSGNKSPSESCCSNHRGKRLDLVCVQPPSDNLNDVDSCFEATSGSSQSGRIEHLKMTRKSLRKNQGKPSGGDIASYEVSPCLTIGDTVSGGSIRTNINQDVDPVDNIHQGCGISCCWSKSPRFRESGLYSDFEDRPLISQHIDEIDLYGHRSMRHISGEISPSLETPRSLTLKFRPKSFSDLVGQNVVARSLLGAISMGRIMSFYLFHGPRGTGKTCAARIFAAALNCLSLEEQKPCGVCRECILFFSGRSKDVKQVDSVRINRTDKLKSLFKNASIPPVSSRFKVFIIDECQLLHGETWASLLNILENLSQHVVFMMITPDLDKLPRSAISRAQRYHFPKIKDADIASRLEQICVEEGLDFEQVALDFIAAKSCGSLRDAEMMLDQLSLLGKKITISLAYELTGVVSDDELLDLLDLALSSDTSNTVIRARELMRSRIDPLQLISQLANLIMDILAGKGQDGGSEARRRFCSRHHSETELQKLSQALRLLSETEKQLKVSKNQTTWLTVALLQLSSIENSSEDANDTKLCLRNACNGDDDLCSTSSTGESLKHLATGLRDNKSYRLGVQEDQKGTLNSIWHEATGLCKSSGLKTFLRKRGKLTSLCVSHGVAIAELEFHHRDYVSKAEKSWKLIASCLQFIVGCNIELRINLVSCNSDSKYAKLKRMSFSFFSCSRRIDQKSFLSNEGGIDSDYADSTSQKPMMKDTYSSDCGLPPRECCKGMEVVATLRSSEGNLLSSGKRLSCQESPTTSGKEDGCNYTQLVSSTLDSNHQSKCLPRTLWLHKKLHSPEKNFDLSIPKYNYSSEPCVFSIKSNSNNPIKVSRNDESARVDSDLLCWRVLKKKII
ncbi:hypothetical protein L6164_014805 [Bauhinia variegata]|uniref:Uncharacterized protein n=1 Tax=Bauhinia variegata TaxID=167791 RepID=A0ACB9NKH1_BAUVA|nr:hypothetical protein L6164_014805 [Bauhinia variegata]